MCHRMCGKRPRWQERGWRALRQRQTEPGKKRIGNLRKAKCQSTGRDAPATKAAAAAAAAKGKASPSPDAARQNTRALCASMALPHHDLIQMPVVPDSRGGTFGDEAIPLRMGVSVSK